MPDPTAVLEDRDAVAADVTDGWRRDYERIAAAITWLDANRVEHPNLDDLAAALHLSPAHLQRTFTRFAGTSPSRFLRWLTAGAARRLLQERASVLGTTAEVGLSSAGRLHELMVTIDAATPGEIGRGGEGVALRYGLHPTPLGVALVATTQRGVAALWFADDGRDAARAALQRDWPRADLVEDTAATAWVAARLRAVLTGDPVTQPLRVVTRGTNLQVRVWEALLRVPEDRVVSYREVARAVGRPDAVRAVASAVGRNPVAALIPCHRVLRTTGEIGGYRWGTNRKRAMLAREAARAAS